MLTAIHGNFDDAQQFLKRLFVDKVTAEEVAAKGVMFLVRTLLTLVA